jgi:hypothetical protein
VAEIEEGVSLVEHFVLHEADGRCQLWELAAAWTDNGTEDARRASVPLLRDAVVALSRRGLIDVYEIVQWPRNPDVTVWIPPEHVATTIAGAQRWLRHGESTSLVTVSLADAGIKYL